MTLSIDFCDDADFPRITDILFDAFGTREHYIDVVYPHHGTPEGRTRHAHRLLAMKHADSTSHWLKVVEDSTGKIIGQAMWQIYREKPPEVPLAGDVWDTEDEIAYAQDLYRAYRVPRRAVIRAATGPVCCLAMLTVDPEYQRRGAGTMMVRWGVDIADRIGAEATVEATSEGRHLYEQHGFHLQEYFLLETAERWAHKPQQRLYFMHRPKKE